MIAGVPTTNSHSTRKIGRIWCRRFASSNGHSAPQKNSWQRMKKRPISCNAIACAPPAREKRAFGRALPAFPIGAAELPWPGRLNQVIDQVHPDLVHAGPLPSCGYLAAKTHFQPIVQMSWGSDLLWEARRNRFALWRAKYALSRAAAVISDCEAVRAAAVDFGASPARIVTFPWGVD